MFSSTPPPLSPPQPYPSPPPPFAPHIQIAHFHFSPLQDRAVSTRSSVCQKQCVVQLNSDVVPLAMQTT